MSWEALGKFRHFWILGVSSLDDLTLPRRVRSCLLISCPLCPLLFFFSLFPPHHLTQDTELHWLGALVPLWAAVSKLASGAPCVSAHCPSFPLPLHLRCPPIPLPPGLPSSPSVGDYLTLPAGPPSSRWLDFSCPWLAVLSLTSPADQKVEKKDDVFLEVAENGGGRRQTWAAGQESPDCRLGSASESTGSLVVGWGV